MNTWSATQTPGPIINKPHTKYHYQNMCAWRYYSGAPCTQIRLQFTCPNAHTHTDTCPCTCIHYSKSSQNTTQRKCVSSRAYAANDTLLRPPRAARTIRCESDWQIDELRQSSGHANVLGVGSSGQCTLVESQSVQCGYKLECACSLAIVWRNAAGEKHEWKNSSQMLFHAKCLVGVWMHFGIQSTRSKSAASFGHRCVL